MSQLILGQDKVTGYQYSYFLKRATNTINLYVMSNPYWLFPLIGIKEYAKIMDFC
ncbi:MAG TPA: hypothetical protein PLC45_07850 [Chitinophagaceae bacterium]|nr:hypothetical protein [Chitinophagaceae bacterium]